MKRRWWLWLLIALACSVIVFVVSELIGISIVRILGWGVLGAFGVLSVIFTIIITTFFTFCIGGLIRFLLECFISNKEILSITLGSLGVCAILVGWILTIRESGWSFLVIMVGFFMGCFAGAEYQGHKLEREKLEYELE